MRYNIRMKMFVANIRILIAELSLYIIILIPPQDSVEGKLLWTLAGKYFSSKKIDWESRWKSRKT